MSPFAESFVFSTVASPLASPAGGNGIIDGDAYQAIRTPSGWHIERHITPAGWENVFPRLGGISSDHAYNFSFAVQPGGHSGDGGILTKEGEGDYLGDPSGHFELTGIGDLGVERLAQGRFISPGGTHVIFSTGRKPGESSWCRIVETSPTETKCPVERLEPDAPPKGTGAIYDRGADGPTHVVSLLPGDVPPAAGEGALYQGSSADGSIVAFKVGGILYVRMHDSDTMEVAGSATFAGFSADGKYLFYLNSGNIHRFNTVTGGDQQITSTNDAEVVNVSADGSHVYFISPSQLDGSLGTAGEPNMYGWYGGPIEYIATVLPSDTTGVPALTRWVDFAVAPETVSGDSRGPGADSSRTTPDGHVIVFESRATLTSYDNAGHKEVYRYDDRVKVVECISCNPSGSPATADAALQLLGAAALNPGTIIHNLTVDGSRVFFQTTEGLVEADTNGINDVYEWQQDPEPGDQQLALISWSGSVEYPNELNVGLTPNVLMGVSLDGRDVFFRSQSPLVPGAGEGGAFAIYDARINGGFPSSSGLPICVDVESCRGAPSPQLALSSPPLRVSSGNVKWPKARCKHRRGRKHHHRVCRKHRGRRS